MGAEGFLCRIDDPYFPVSHFAQFFCELLHISVHPGLHVIVKGKHATLFQHSQAFQQKTLLVRAVDIMIDIIAYYGIKVSS